MSDVCVADVMTRLVVEPKPDDDLEIAAKKLFTNRISGAPVVEEGHVVGVVSEVDLRRSYADLGRRFSPDVSHDGSPVGNTAGDPRTSVREVMSHKVVGISAGASIGEAASLMDRFGVSRLPVINGDRVLLGLVARADVIRAIAGRWEANLAPIAEPQLGAVPSRR